MYTPTETCCAKKVTDENRDKNETQHHDVRYLHRQRRIAMKLVLK